MKGRPGFQAFTFPNLCRQRWTLTAILLVRDLGIDLDLRGCMLLNYLLYKYLCDHHIQRTWTGMVADLGYGQLNRKH